MGWFSRKKEKRSRMNVQYIPTGEWSTVVYSDSRVVLADDVNVNIAVNKIADLVSNMTIHLLENTANGNKRVNNNLQKLIDISPAKNMTRKAWITKLIRDLFIFGDGNSIFKIVVEPGSEYLTELRPLDMSNISYKYDKEKNELQVLYKGEVLPKGSYVHFMINPNPEYPLIGKGYQ